MFDDQKVQTDQFVPAAANPFANDRSLLAADLPVKKSKNKIWIPLVGLLVFILLAGGAGAYYYYNYIYWTPQKVLLTAIDNLSTLKSGSVNYQFDALVKSKSNGQTETSAVSLFLPSAQQFNLKGEIKTDFLKQADFTQSATEINIDIPTGQELPIVGKITISPKLNLISLNKNDLFLKIANIPQLPFFDVSQFNDKWIKFDLAELQKTYGLKFDNSNQPTTQENEKVVNELKAIYQKNQFLTLTKAGNEKIDQVPCWHYKAVLNKDVFKQYLNEVKGLFAREGYDKKYNINLDSMLNNADEQLKTMTISGDYWVTSKEKMFKKISILLVVDTESASLNLNLNFVWSNFNQPVNISTPSEFKTFKEVIDALMGTTLGASQQKADAAKTIADIKQIQTGLELYYNDHNAYPLPPLRGNSLGLDATCLGQKGFLKNKICDQAYLSYIPIPEGANDYLYYLCSDQSYAIEFSLPSDISQYKAGKLYATESGIVSDWQIKSDCLDPDADGLPNFLEKKYKTDPNKEDTDGDGFLDGEEVASGYNPNGPGKLIK